MNVYNRQNIIPASTVMSATLNSSAQQLMDMINFGIQIVFTGTPAGSFKLQSSCDPVATANQLVPLVPTNWTDIAGSMFSVSAAGSVEWDYQNCGFNYVRVVYT